MEQPVLEHGLVASLSAHAPSHDQNVHDPEQAHQSPKSRDDGDPLPRRAGDGRRQQHGSKVDDARRRKGPSGLRFTFQDRLRRNERNDDELQPNEGAG